MATSKRRLSAILYADLAGSIEDEENPARRYLESAQGEIVRPAIESAGGSLLDSAEDSTLAEFGSALAAVTAAINIQEHMARFNDALDLDQRMIFRIGVHLGEVLDEEEGHNIY